MQIQQQDWASRWALYAPDREALKEFETGRTYTYCELNRLGNRLAHHLTGALGLRSGDRIAVLAENCLEYVALFVAAQKTGLILVPLNYRLAVAEIDYLIGNAAPSLLITEEKFQHLLPDAPAPRLAPHHWNLGTLSQFCASEIELPEDQDFPVTAVEEDHPIFILYTSGTTGFPKGALYTHKMLFWNSINTAMSLIINSESRTVNCMPPFHTGGWNVLTLPFLHHGGYTCMMKKFDPAAVLTALESERCTLFMGVPTMLKMIAELPDFQMTDFSNLYYLIVGGEPMPIPLIEQWHAKNVPIRQGYGMTEVGPNLTSLHQRDAIRKKGSIGRPNFYVEINIVDEKGESVAPNQPGELLLRGPMVTPGYWQNEAATRAAFGGDMLSGVEAGVLSGVEAWFHTGDLVRQDEEGYLYVVDRIKNMFISGGENVYPAEVERVLVSHPGVAEAAVIGVPDEKWGESGKAFVVCKSGLLVSESELLVHCEKHLAKFKIPKYLVFLEALPKNDTGKINRMALKIL
ncbi:MAG: long-chain fatty acid--CoA ligase [Saprospiraceae bacterium]|nr:long-chain fatty acid--CoA ligase [Saprospiraceae bacterium]MDZ4705577.1 long-chain fatty acid--CoA ligase [Saprospiraceae bacterium]